MGMRDFYKRIKLEFKRGVKANWGFPFIVGFLLLLLSAAVLLATGLSSAAELMANAAYLALAVGVMLEIACLGKNIQKAT
jgi:hypothetical protein